ncbi:MAG TPA: hemerythrin domain-containing protein [Actinophytocola sp.]|jgi:hemerythrin-like domain-containing protein|uniref:hemerythrin domain-containing protein n=1 Tax=Actinophytocola sp. TaxID=1872138 RepID=UPI002F938FAD
MSQTNGAVDTWEMVVVHKAFRREFGRVAGLIRQVADGDRRRAEIVADHIAFLTDGLHHHHTAEDEVLWPMLLDRVGELDGELVHRMETQHETVGTLIARANELLPRWRARADKTTGEELANVFEKMSVALNEHLTDEETEILPLCSKYLTQAEWESLGKRGQEGLPKGAKAFVALGGILEDATPQERTRFLAGIPLPARVLWRVVGKGIYRRELARVQG